MLKKMQMRGITLFVVFFAKKALVFDMTKIAVVDIGLYSTDIGSDLWTAHQYFEKCNTHLACATLVFVMLLTLPSFIE